MPTIDSFFAAMDRGAACVYHKLMAVESDVTKWEYANPALANIVFEGVAFGNAFLTAHGIDVTDINVAGAAVVAALKMMAANDASVQTVTKTA